VVALEKRALMCARELTAARAEGVDALRVSERRVAEAERRAQVQLYMLWLLVCEYARVELEYVLQLLGYAYWN